jgi:transcriptional regulator with XRE-family HTH domain
MVRTEKQLSITKEKVRDFETQLTELQKKKEGMEPFRYMLDENALKSMIDGLNAEIKEYETLSNENCKSFTFENFGVADFPDILIKARLVRKMNQTELAKTINVESQQIQRYESNGYDGVSFGRLLEIQYALGLKINCTGQIISNDIFDIGDDNEVVANKREEEYSVKSVIGA